MIHSMDNEIFEWDDTKAAENYAAHGVSFEAARDVFKDAFAVDWLAYEKRRYHEENGY
jgi:uncharacterized DUF497 family protein